MSVSFALLALSQVSSLHAQHVQSAARLPGPPRIIALGDHRPNQLAVDSAGKVTMACSAAHSSGAVVRLDRSGRLRSTGLSGSALAISGDGRFLAGSWPGSSGYGEGLWWEVEPATLAVLGVHEVAPGDASSSLGGVENTPLGLVLVGSHFGGPIDLRPPASASVLPGLEPWNLGAADALSADGRIYAGSSYGLPACWVDRVPEALHNPSGFQGSASVSRDGANFAGVVSDGGNRPVVWLARDGRVQRRLLGPAGAPLKGAAHGVLDSELVFGTGRRGPQESQEFGWIWHPDLGSDAVLPIEEWLARWNLPGVVVELVADVVEAGTSYHFALQGGPTGTFTTENWYAETPRI
jgi:hypothetical protein